MFSDILIESQLLNEPLMIKESFFELRYKQKQLLMEMANYFNELSPNIMHESSVDDVENKKMSLIRRFIEFFKKIITKLKAFLDKKFNLTYRKINRLVKLLLQYEGKNKETYTSIEVETHSYINNFDSIINTLKKAAEELRTYNIDEVIETFINNGIFKKMQVGVQIVSAIEQIKKGSFMNGYVASLKKYDNLDTEKIKEDMLGFKKVIKGIEVKKFVDYVNEASKFRDQLTVLDTEYTKVLNGIGIAFNITDSTDMIKADRQHIFTKLVSMITNFFNKNIDLIMKLNIAILDTTIHTAINMAHKVGLIKVNDKVQDM